MIVVMIKRHLPAFLLLASLSLFLNSCHDSLSGSGPGPGGTVDPGSSLKLIQLQGNGQSAAPGATLEKEILMQITFEGVPVPGINVTWTTGSGSVSLPTTITDSEGIAGTFWTLGSDLGQYTLVGTVEDLEGRQYHVTFTATAVEPAGDSE